MRISDWSSDVCSSDLGPSNRRSISLRSRRAPSGKTDHLTSETYTRQRSEIPCRFQPKCSAASVHAPVNVLRWRARSLGRPSLPSGCVLKLRSLPGTGRSEEHTYGIQSLMRITYADFCL